MTFRHLLALAAAASLPLALPSAAGAATTSGASTTACKGANIIPNKRNAGRVRSATLCLINVERTSRGLRRLRASKQLRKAATNYSRTMVRKRFFDHVGPRGSTMVSRIKRTNYLKRGVRDWALGENIGWASGSLATPRQMVRIWMDSAGHRKNILNRRFRHVGIGVATGAPVRGKVRRAATYTTDFGYRIRK